uniref:Uncharacterized protein LOC104215693 n=1 Tax=Nicotiana sylvestris TaxID=4096 RepID=A0A1U7VG38_NICSY|nr:PREDICTED: uncharacterized protein LOC104215693 [Nicotiana sylvestris]
MDKEGVLQTDLKTITAVLVDFYMELLGTKGDHRIKAFINFLHSGHILTMAQQLDLVKHFNNKEIKNASFSIGSNKSTCPDDYSSDFFKAVWCISKLIRKRLRKAITPLVAENQAAFAEGRSQVHNILICHDLLGHNNSKTTPRCLMKIDIRNASDMVSWEFIEKQLLHKLNRK